MQPTEIWQAAVSLISEDSDPFGQLLEPFMSRVNAMKAPRILELGTRQAIPGTSTRKDQFFPHASEFVGTDIEAGVDVDVLADVHRLSRYLGEESFDVILTDAGFEHFKYPHLAAHEVMKTLRVGGLVFVRTHQTFPLHAVPYDYCRFSTEALKSLFGERMGMKVLGAAYSSPAAIYSHVDPGGQNHPAYLHVNLFAEKVAPTPRDYAYEFDCLLDTPPQR